MNNNLYLEKELIYQINYRFSNPEDKHYPEQLELFSRKPGVLGLSEEDRLTKISLGKDISSLSAILLDDEYYALIQSGTVDKDGLSIVKPEYLIPLKIRAWMDLKQRREAGESVDSTKLRKHRNDIFRLLRVINPSGKIKLEDQVREDVKEGLKLLGTEENIDKTSQQLSNRTTTDVTNILKHIYSIDE